MSIKHLDVCHKLGQEKTQPRVTPLSRWDIHSPRETPLRNKQGLAIVLPFLNPWSILMCPVFKELSANNNVSENIWHTWYENQKIP